MYKDSVRVYGRGGGRGGGWSLPESMETVDHFGHVFPVVDVGHDGVEHLRNNGIGCLDLQFQL